MIVEGQKRTATDIISVLQELIDAHEAVNAVRAALHGALQGEQQKEGVTAVTVSAVRQLALYTFGSQPEVLADFGIAPRKSKRVRTTREKLGAVDTALETRKARHTLGRKQREAIHGSAPLVTTVVTPPSPGVPAPHLNGSSAPMPNGAPQNGGG